MKRILRKLWHDDAGVVALEYLLLATVVGLGLVVGLSSLSEALNQESVELSNAILALDQSFTFNHQTSGTFNTHRIGFRAGTGTHDFVNRNRMEVNELPTTVGISIVP